MKKSGEMHKEIKCFDVKNDYIISIGSDQQLKKSFITPTEENDMLKTINNIKIDIDANFIKVVPDPKNSDQVIIGNSNQLNMLNIQT